MSVNYITIDESEFDELVADNAKLRKQVEVAVKRIDNALKYAIDMGEVMGVLTRTLAEIERIGKS